MPNEHGRETWNAVCPKELCGDSEELLTFIQLPKYTQSFVEIGLTDDEQRAVEIGIMMNPILSPVIDGTGGIREFEFGVPQDGPGSLHLSAFYAYFPESGKVALIGLFDTESIGEISLEDRAILKQLFEEIQEFGPEAWEG